MKTTTVDGAYCHVGTNSLRIATLTDILKDCKSQHDNCLAWLRDLALKIKSESFSIQESIDIGFLLRECETNLDEMRKDFKAHKNAIGKQTCFRLSQLDEEKARGQLAIGSVKVSHFSRLPHPEKEPEKFKKLCKFFNIDISDIPLGSIRFHWPTVKEYVTKCMEQGIELPSELSDVDVELEMTYRRRV